MEDATTSTDSIRPESLSDQSKFIQGVLQAIEAVIASVILGLTMYYTPAVEGFFASPSQTFLLVVSFVSLLVSFLLFISSLIDISCSVTYSKSIFLPSYLLLTSLLYSTSSIALLIYAAANSKFYNIYISKGILPGGVRKTVYGGFIGLLVAAVLGLLNSILYLVSLVLFFRPHVKGEKSVPP